MPAGLRTHILICLGSTLFTLISVSFSEGDPTRIASGIVTGIGFLGAGAIFKSKNHVIGLTTAADIWVVSAIGLAIGLNFYSAAAITTLIAFIILFLGRILKKEVNN